MCSYGGVVTENYFIFGEERVEPLLVMPHPETRTVSVGIYTFAGGIPQNVVIAASVIAALPTVIIFLIFQRNIMSGLTAGSVKG